MHEKIVRFNSNLIALPDVGVVQSVLDFHPQYVHLDYALRCRKEHLKC